MIDILLLLWVLVLIWAILSIMTIIVLYPMILGAWQYYDAKRYDLDSPIAWMSLTIIIGYVSGLTLGLVPVLIYLIYYSDERNEIPTNEQETDTTSETGKDRADTESIESEESSNDEQQE